MNRQQRRQARHRNPALAARAKFEQALRDELQKRNVVLINASTAEQNKVPCWVLVVKRGTVEMTLSAKPQGVLALAAAVALRFDDPERAERESQAAAGVTQSAAPPAVTGAAKGNGAPMIELSDDPEQAAEQLLGLGRPLPAIEVPDTSYDDLLSAENPLLPGAAR